VAAEVLIASASALPIMKVKKKSVMKGAKIRRE
jgi:hypothetical protein